MFTDNGAQCVLRDLVINSDTLYWNLPVTCVLLIYCLSNSHCMVTALLGEVWSVYARRLAKVVTTHLHVSKPSQVWI